MPRRPTHGHGSGPEQVLQLTERSTTEVHSAPPQASQAQLSSTGPVPQGFGWHSTRNAPPMRATQIWSSVQVLPVPKSHSNSPQGSLVTLQVPASQDAVTSPSVSQRTHTQR